MGALIHSTVNAIWLASKLGFEPRIWWGARCLYNRPGDAGDCYRLFFQSPAAAPDAPCDLGRGVYPATLAAVGFRIPFGVAEAEVATRMQATSWSEEDRDVLRAAQTAVLFQYLADDAAWKVAYGSGVPVRPDEMDAERDIIFRRYFAPRDHLLRRAKQTARGMWGDGRSVVGVHVRATDKFGEKAVPSARRMAGEAFRVARAIGAETVFVATDSVDALRVCTAVLPPSLRVVSQDIRRGGGARGVHFDKGTAFQNGEDIVCDIELLAMCERVVAFPGSQVHWWLSMRLGRSEARQKLVGVHASLADWCSLMTQQIRAGTLIGYLVGHLRRMWHLVRDGG